MLSRVCTRGDLIRAKLSPAQEKFFRGQSKYPKTLYSLYWSEEAQKHMHVEIPIGAYGIVISRTDEGKQYLVFFPDLGATNVFLTAECIELVDVDNDLDAVSR